MGVPDSETAIDWTPAEIGERSRLRLLLDRLSIIEDVHEPHRVAYPLSEILLLAVCGTIADGDDYDDIGDWAVFGLFLGLGAGLLARPARSGGDRRQDLEAQPRPRR